MALSLVLSRHIVECFPPVIKLIYDKTNKTFGSGFALKRRYINFTCHWDRAFLAFPKTWSLVCFVACDFLTAMCDLAILNVCVIIVLSRLSHKHTAIVFPVFICWAYYYEGHFV